jgi:hypothetical protein
VHEPHRLEILGPIGEVRRTNRRKINTGGLHGAVGILKNGADHTDVGNRHPSEKLLQRPWFREKHVVIQQKEVFRPGLTSAVIVQAGKIKGSRHPQHRSTSRKKSFSNLFNFCSDTGIGIVVHERHVATLVASEPRERCKALGREFCSILKWNDDLYVAVGNRWHYPHPPFGRRYCNGRKIETVSAVKKN